MPGWHETRIGQEFVAHVNTIASSLREVVRQIPKLTESLRPNGWTLRDDMAWQLYCELESRKSVEDCYELVDNFLKAREALQKKP